MNKNNNYIFLLPRSYNWVALVILIVALVLPFISATLNINLSAHIKTTLFNSLIILSLLLFSVVKLKKEDAKSIEIREKSFIATFLGMGILIFLYQFLQLFLIFTFNKLNNSEFLLILSLLAFQSIFRVSILMKNKN